MVQSDNETRTVRSRMASALPPLIVWCAFAFLLRQMPPDGREHGNLAQFVGRFHVLLLHLPLALLLVVPVLEIVGRRHRWSTLAPVAGGILSIACFIVFLTALDGWLLAWSGGYRGRDITLHMWAGFWLAGTCGAASLARCGSLPRRLYPVLLASAVGLMFWTGHTGGSISHGDSFLSEKMPARLRVLLGMPAQAPKAAEAPGAAGVVHAGPGSADPANPAYFAVHIAPVLARSCVSCHRPEKHKGGLMMDTYEHLLHGGDDGPAIVPGNTKSSELLRRVRLPASDDDSMPSDGDKPLTPEEIQMIDLWIAAGARSG
jgi:uncharacterized membrane protein